MLFFSCYINKLLFNLEANGIAYFIDKMFVGGLAYPDDIALIEPTSRAMRIRLFTCDSFANNFSIVFNAKISKFLMFEPTRKAGSLIIQMPVFYVGSDAI